jgi:hypothetical protein
MTFPAAKEVDRRAAEGTPVAKRIAGITTRLRAEGIGRAAAEKDFKR